MKGHNTPGEQQQNQYATMEVMERMLKMMETKARRMLVNMFIEGTADLIIFKPKLTI